MNRSQLKKLVIECLNEEIQFSNHVMMNMGSSIKEVRPDTNIELVKQESSIQKAFVVNKTFEDYITLFNGKIFQKNEFDVIELNFLKPATSSTTEIKWNWVSENSKNNSAIIKKLKQENSSELSYVIFKEIKSTNPSENSNLKTQVFISIPFKDINGDEELLKNFLTEIKIGKKEI
jgi:hypothetical protein